MSVSTSELCILSLKSCKRTKLPRMDHLSPAYTANCYSTVSLRQLRDHWTAPQRISWRLNNTFRIKFIFLKMAHALWTFWFLFCKNRTDNSFEYPTFLNVLGYSISQCLLTRVPLPISNGLSCIYKYLGMSSLSKRGHPNRTEQSKD